MDIDEILEAEMPSITTAGGSVLVVSELLRVDAGNLDNEMLKHASYQGFIGFQHAEAELMVSRASRKMRQLRATKFFYYKEHMESIYGVRPTADTVEAAVEKDVDVIKGYAELADLEHRERQLYVLREAFLARKDALVHLSANERIERRLRPVD